MPEADPRSKTACAPLQIQLSTLETWAKRGASLCHCGGNALKVVDAYLADASEDRMKVIVSSLEEVNKAKPDLWPASRLTDLLEQFFERIDIRQVAKPRLANAFVALRTSCASILQSAAADEFDLVNSVSATWPEQYHEAMVLSPWAADKDEHTLHIGALQDCVVIAGGGQMATTFETDTPPEPTEQSRDILRAMERLDWDSTETILIKSIGIEITEKFMPWAKCFRDALTATP